VTGGRHGRRAALPPAGYARERQLDPAALTVTVPGESGGTEAVLDFGVLPDPLQVAVRGLRRDVRRAPCDC
jgi:hypothetical protein